jgi:hypothetical protein
VYYKARFIVLNDVISYGTTLIINSDCFNLEKELHIQLTFARETLQKLETIYTRNNLTL